jgi:hypothetical protein
MPMNPHCAECGEVDELNITFCVACGAKLLYAYDGTGSTPVVSSGAGSSSASKPSGAAGASGSPGAPGAAAGSGSGRAGKFKRNTGFNWTAEITAPQGGRDASKTPMPQFGDVQKISGQPARQKASAAGMPALMPVTAGVACGVLIVGVLYSIGFLPDLFDRVTWPKSGLVVYCPVLDTTSLPGDPGASGAAGGNGAAGTSGTTGTTGANGSSKGAQSAASDGSGSTKTASGSSDSPSDTSGDSSGDSGAATASSSDDTKQGSSGADDDSKPAGSGGSSSGGSNSGGSASGAGTADPANSNSSKGSVHDTGGSWQLSVENLANHQLTISPLIPARSLLGRRVPGCLILKDLAAGNYMLRIQRAGSDTTFGMVTLVADKPTVIGYPGGMKLPI